MESDNTDSKWGTYMYRDTDFGGRGGESFARRTFIEALHVINSYRLYRVVHHNHQVQKSASAHVTSLDRSLELPRIGQKTQQGTFTN